MKTIHLGALLVVGAIQLGCGGSNICTLNGVSYSCPSSSALDTCIGGDPTPCAGSAKPDGGGGAITIPCDGANCDGNKEYCLDGRSATRCAPLPSGCSACGCLPSADKTWRQLENDTNNCARGSTCSASSTAGITVTCL